MENIIIAKILKDNGLDRGIIEWKDNLVPPTEYWYDVINNDIQTSCGIKIPFIYDIRTQMARCRYDITNAVREYYKNNGILIESLDD